MFLRPKTQPSPPSPTIDDTAAAQQQYGDQLRMRQGRAAAILTGTNGPGTPTTAAKVLLGS